MKRLVIIARNLLLILVLIAWGTPTTLAQCGGYSRIYPNAEDHSGLGISNANNAIGNDLTNYSTIAIPSLGFSRYQQLKFSQNFTAGQPIHIKLGSTTVLAVGAIEVEIQAYHNNTAVGSPITLASGIANLLGGVNVLDVIVPSPSANYNAVRVTVTSLISVAGQLAIYGAYVNQAVSSTDCEAVTDVISGSTSGVASALNSVTNPNNAVDASLSSYSELRQNVGVAGYVHLTTLFPSVALAGDSVVVLLKVPGSSLLDASVFSKLTVVTYLGTNIVETVPANASLVAVRLLDATNHIYRFAYPASSAFDRISVQAGGIASALAEVYIYDVKRTIPQPKVLIDAANVLAKSICIGASTTLSVDPIASCTTYNWYDSATGGNLINTGTSFPQTGLSVGIHHYYVEAVRNGCSATTSTRTVSQITVNPLPNITLGNNPSICLGANTAILPFTATAEMPTLYSVNWTNPSFSNVVNAPFPSGSSIGLNLPMAVSPGTYNGTLTLKNSNGCVSGIYNFNVTVQSAVPAPTFIISSN